MRSIIRFMWSAVLGVLIPMLVCAIGHARAMPQFDPHPPAEQARATLLQVAGRQKAPDVATAGATADAGTWSIGDGVLSRFAADGSREFALSLRDAGAGDPTLLAIDAYDDSVWVVTTRRLLAHFDSGGTLRRIVSLDGTASALGMALDQTLWAAVDGALVHLGREGQVLSTAVIPRPAPEHLLVDSLRDRIWTISGRILRALDLDAAVPRVVADLTASDHVDAASLDPIDGRLWILASGGVYVVDVAGPIVELVAPGTYGGAASGAIDYDAIRDGFVVTSPTGSLVLDRDGNPFIVTDRKDEGGAVMAIPFRLLPELDLVDFAEPREPGQSEPTVVLRLAASCSGRLCDVGPEYLAGLSLFATVDGDPVDAVSSFDDATRVATLQLPGRVSEFSVVTVHAVDRFGHVSEGVEATLRLPEWNSARLKANQAPTVAITLPANNATFVPGSSVVITASAGDTDGRVVRVDFLRGNTLIGSSTTSPYTATWANVPAGSYSLTAKATDDNGGTKTSSSVNIIVKAPPNVAPAVSIVSPTAGSTVNGPTVVLTATARDADGTIAKVDFSEGTKLLGTVTGGTASVNAAWTYANIAAGPHSIKISATDNSGAVASATVSFTVNVAPFTVLTSPAACSEVISPIDVIVAADAHDFDGTVARVDFLQGTTLIGSVNKAPYRLVWTNPPVGNYTLTAVAVDNLGATRSSNPVSFSVQVPDIPPEVVVTSPTSGAKIDAGSTVTIAATANDSDGSVKRVEFFEGTRLIGASAAAPFSARWTPSAAGTYVLAARAFDNRGVSTTSAPVTVSVLRVNKPPIVTITSPAENAMFLPGQDIAITATAFDYDDGVSSVTIEGYADGELRWQEHKLGGPYSTGNYSFRWSSPPAGAAIMLIGRGYDVANAEAYGAPVRVKTAPPPTVQLLTPVADETFAAPATITFTAAASQPLGKIARVDYYESSRLIGSATTPPYTFIWANVPFSSDGPLRYIHAEAVDNLGAGGRAATPRTEIYIDRGLLSITSPVADSELYSGQIEVKGTYAGPAPSAISVNGVPASFGGGNFSATIALQPGGNMITVSATNSSGAFQKQVYIKYLVPSITLTSPASDVQYQAPAWANFSASIENFEFPPKRVDFWLGSTRVGSVFDPPYTVPYKLTTGGTRWLSATAVAADESIIESPGVFVTVFDPPGITITSPPDNSVFSDTEDFNIAVTARSGGGVFAKVEVRRNGSVVGTREFTAQEKPNVLGINVYSTPLPSGSYEYIVRTTETTGRTMTSEPLHIVVSSGPAVALVLPKPNQRFKSPARLTLGAKASTQKGTISTVDFLANDVVVATATTEPFVATWNGIGSGTYALKARATDSTGRTATSRVTSVIVGDVALNMDTPENEETIYEPTVTVGGTFEGLVAPVEITVNGVPAKVGNGTYAATVPLTLGSNDIYVVATSGGVTVRSEIRVTRAEPSITFYGISNGASVPDDNILIHGRVLGPRNAALSIGNVIADVDPDGRFIANNVPIPAGTSSISVKLIRQDGTVTGWSLDEITRERVQPFVTEVRPPVGFGLPFEVLVSVTRRADVDFSRVQMTWNGNVFLEEEVTDDKDQLLYRLTYGEEGTHAFTIKVIDANGSEVYSHDVAVRVASPGEADTQIRDMFIRMTYRLLAGDITSAVTAFDPESREHYRSAFVQAGSQLPGFVDILRGVSSVTFGQTYGAIMLTRSTSNGVAGYPIHVTRDPYGIWRLSGM